MHTLLCVTSQTFHPQTVLTFLVKMRKTELKPPRPIFPPTTLALGEGGHKVANSSLKQSKVPTSVMQISIYQYLQHPYFS